MSILYIYHLVDGMREVYISTYRKPDSPGFSLHLCRNYGMIIMKEGDHMGDIATLGNESGFSVFSYGNRVIRFKAPYSLKRYTSVKEWDNGYLVVMAKYSHNPQPEEEYIDLLPILNGLYINGQEFLKPIKGVMVVNC